MFLPRRFLLFGQKSQHFFLVGLFRSLEFHGTHSAVTSGSGQTNFFKLSLLLGRETNFFGELFIPQGIDQAGWIVPCGSGTIATTAIRTLGPGRFLKGENKHKDDGRAERPTQIR